MSLTCVLLFSLEYAAFVAGLQFLPVTTEVSRSYFRGLGSKLCDNSLEILVVVVFKSLPAAVTIWY